jgi:hypothetical protein
MNYWATGLYLDREGKRQQFGSQIFQDIFAFYLYASYVRQKHTVPFLSKEHWPWKIAESNYLGVWQIGSSRSNISKDLKEQTDGGREEGGDRQS